jgi:DNA invertase Pin-like site-specific DNA recombinase
MENAVIYARYSSTGQNDQTIDGQIRIAREFAESKGYNVVKTYIDKAKSAWSDSEKRVDFQKMLTDAKSGGFQHIIVYKFDRFARNRLDSQMYKQRLKKDYGIRVQPATEPVSDDEGGEIYEMFLEWNDEKYSQRLSKRVRDGFDTSVAKGKFTGGVVIFGYKLIKEPVPNKPNSFESKIVVDEQPAEIVRFVFTQYASGTDKKEIARKLNEKGLTLNGKPFNGRSFDHWLVNSKYYGLYRLALL